MSKRKKGAPCETIAPEQVIVSRLRHLAGREEIASFLVKLVWMAVLLTVLFRGLFGIAAVKNNDMMPRISSGDLVLYYRLEQKLRSQDVVVFEKSGVQYIGRIVAAGGDSVEITEDSYLKVNESTVVESDIYYSTPRYESNVEYPVALGENQYFILGDFRDNAKDSRYFGAVDRGEIKGRVITVIRRSSL